MTGGARWRRAAALGFVFGIGFFGVLLAWVTIVGYVAWAALIVMQATFVALFGALWAASSRRLSTTLARVAAAAGLWGTIEWLRAVFPVEGFPWGQLAQSQTPLAWMTRPASIGGAIFVSMWLVAINSCMAEAWWKRGPGAGTRLGAAAGAVGLVLLPMLIPARSATGDPVSVAIVQGNTPPVPPSFAKDIEIARSHSDLTRSLEPSPDLVVWPESSLGHDPAHVPEMTRALEGAARGVDAPMIVGANSYLPGGDYHVLAYEVAADGTITDRYQKTHLVPFGEYVPYRGALGWIPMLDQVPLDAVAGDRGEVFDVAGGRVAPVISFEGDFGSLVRERVAAGGRLVVVATNTSTWGHSWVSAQHLAFSRLRAVENGVWVVHAAISGLSGFVAPSGAVLDRTDLFDATTVTRTIRFADDVTPFARAGDWVLVATWAALFAVAATGLRRRGVETGRDTSTGAERRVPSHDA